MKEESKTKLKPFILTAFLLFLTTAIFPASNRSTCPTFGSRSVNAISSTASITKSHQQIYIVFHYEITLIYIPTHHSSQCRRHGITHHGPQGQTTAYYYNESGLLSEVKDGSNQTLATYEYESGTGKLHKITQMENGTIAAVTELTYREGDGKLLEQNTTINGQIAIRDSFQYDVRGNVTKKEEKRGEKERSYEYTYYKDDLLNSYTVKENNQQIEQVEYEHDTAGNRIKETHTTPDQTVTIENTYNGLNQLINSTTTTTTSGTQPQTHTQTVTYSYDDAGRLLKIQPIDSNGNPLPETHSYTYNEFGQLHAFDGPGGAATYGYSFDGKRISKYANGTLYDYTYHQSLLLEEYAETRGRINKYVIGLNNIGRINSQGKYQPYILDMQRSVIGIVSNGELQQAYSYTPYGKTDYTKNTYMPSTIQYLSRQYDTETGDYYLINRYYNAATGRFLSPDKYKYVNTATPFTWNLYQYAFSNPLRYTDPEGNIPLQAWVRGHREIEKVNKIEREERKYGINPSEYEQLLEEGYTSNGTGEFNRYLLSPTLPDQLQQFSGWIRQHRGGYLFQQTVKFREGDKTTSIKPVHYGWNPTDSWEMFFVNLKAGYTSNNADTTSGFTNRDGSLNLGYTLGHSLSTGEKLLGVLGIESMGGQLAQRLAEAERLETRARVLGAIEESRNGRISNFAEYDRKHAAYNFYMRTGWETPRILDQMKGIDFTHPVWVSEVEKNSILFQWVKETRGVGNYFATSAVSPDKLGIARGNRVLNIFATQESTKALVSTAKGVEDIWTIPGKKIVTEGGEIQYFIFEKWKVRKLGGSY